MDDLKKQITALQLRGQNVCIFIAGFGGSGKTTLCKELQQSFPDSVHILSDWFIKQETELRKKLIQKACLSQDKEKIVEMKNPCNWYDWDLFRQKLKVLKNEKIFSLSHGWNQKTGKKDLNIELSLKTSNTLILCDGIYLLQDKMKNIGDFNIWIDTEHEVCKKRYFSRDNHRSSKEYLEQKWKWFEKHDLPLLEVFRNNADFSFKL